jgi:hypothetical protein
MLLVCRSAMPHLGSLFFYYNKKINFLSEVAGGGILDDIFAHDLQAFLFSLTGDLSSRRYFGFNNTPRKILRAQAITDPPLLHQFPSSKCRVRHPLQRKTLWPEAHKSDFFLDKQSHLMD